LLCAIALLALVGVASAKTHHQSGVYDEGAQTGTQPGISMLIGQTRFSVYRLVVTTKCSSAGGSPIASYGGFVASSTSKLAGRISNHGAFTGSFNDGQGDTVSMRGHIKGHNLTVTVNYTGTQTDSTGATLSCTGMTTFHPVNTITGN
jgi:hypothetical protein